MVKLRMHEPYRIVIYFFILLLLLSACVPKVEKLVEEGDTETLIKLLEYKRKAEVRAEAAAALGEMEFEDAVDPLLERLSDEDEMVRAAAAEALGKIGDQSVIPSLINQLKDESSAARSGATDGLVLFGAQAVDGLIGSLSSSDSAFRNELVGVLAKIGLPAIPSLLDALSSPVQNAKQGANDALVAMGSTGATFLVSHFSDVDKANQTTVKTILAEMGPDAVDSLIDGLADADHTIADMSHEILVEIGSPAIQSLIDALEDESTAWQVTDVLVEIGEPAVEPLINALSDPDLDVQAGDVLILMGEGALNGLIAEYEDDPETYQDILRPLTYGLRLDDEDLREKVHAILVAIGETSVPEILAMTKESNKVVVGAQTFYADDIHYSPYNTVNGQLVIGGLCEETIPSEGQIVLCQRGENYFIDKVIAAQEGGAIGVIIFNNEEGTLNATLGEDNEAQIVAVAVTMEEGETLIETAAGQEVLLVGEDTSQVPLTLAEIGTLAIPYLLEVLRNEELVSTAEDTLIEMGSLAAPEILAVFEDEGAFVQDKLIYVMGEINDERFNDTVIGALENDDSRVREEAAYALAAMLLEESIEPLIAKLVDEEAYVVGAAEYALTRIGLPAVEALLTTYHEGDGSMSSAAATVLRDIFEDNQAEIEDMAAGVCSGTGQPEASAYSRYESDLHPMVVAYEDGDLHYWTDYVPVDWLPFTPEDLELVVCVTSQEKQVVQVCRYVYSGSGASAPSITRYRYEMSAKLYAAQTGYLIGSTTLRGSSPDYCPYTTSAGTTQITGGYVSMDDFRTWISVYGVDLED